MSVRLVLLWCAAILLQLYHVNGQFGGGFNQGAGGSNAGFSSHSTSFNNNRRGFGAAFGGGSSSTNFNHRVTEGGASRFGSVNGGGIKFREAAQYEPSQFRYASPYDVASYTHPALPVPAPYAPAPPSYALPAPAIPCPPKILVGCQPQIEHVPCSAPPPPPPPPPAYGPLPGY